VEEIIHQLRGEGIKRIAVVSNEPQKYPPDFPRFEGLTVDHRDRMPAIQKQMRELPGTTVIIYDQTCAAEKRRRAKREKVKALPTRVFINEEVCEGCGDCSVESNCLSLLPTETELGRKRTIDQNACNHDYSCLKGFCPSFVSVIGGELRKSSIAANNGGTFTLPELPPPQTASVQALASGPWNVVITGIGGTGVLTVGSVLAMAAHLEGKGCSTLNQTGLAQKFGAVISHVRIAGDQQAIHSVRIPAGDADLLLGCDLVVCASDDALAKLHLQRSHVVANDYASVTSDFIQNPDYVFPGQEMKASLLHEAGEDKVDFINATLIAKSLLGDSIASNFFLLGFAYQKGLIPVASDSIEQAITLNNVAIEMNISAFQLGRCAVVDYALLEKQLPASDQGNSRLTDLDEIIQWRVEFLRNYQDTEYAQGYLDFVEKVRLLETQKLNPADTSDLSFTKAVAQNYFKLLAYKDEYEVARMYSDDVFLKALRQQFSGDFKLKFHLAPPLISRKDELTKLPIKGVYGQWILRVFPLLAKLKFLRGTAFDIFGYSRERRLERQLIIDYKRAIEQVATDLDEHCFDTALKIAELPERVRGYGHVKEKSIIQFGEQLEALLHDFHQLQTQVVKIFTRAA
ncbi:MAG: 2-oxoacid:acceptor oxidoreductase family protein, partial [Proteobacteria bacterium]|nr:2-oxoacid:acceptor oxidoreductase family protein [Pseudomonadota bacterium]